MTLDFRTPTALSYFETLVRNPSRLPLLETAASLAMDDYPELDLQSVLTELDLLASRLKRHVGRNREPLDRVHLLGEFFFSVLGFTGNINDFDNPENSFIHRVLLKRQGIPITLGILWLELAGSLNLRVSGVNFPGRFLVQADVGMGKVVIDPFSGHSLSEHDLIQRLGDVGGAADQGMHIGEVLAVYLSGAGPDLIVLRMLRNLQRVYRTDADWERLVPIQSRIIIMKPKDWVEYRNRGLALAELGDRQGARQDLSRYLQEAPDADDRPAMQALLEDLGGTVY